MRTILAIILGCFLFGVNAQNSKIKVTEKHGEVFKHKGGSFVDVFELSTGGYWSISRTYEGGGVMGGGLLRSKRVFYVQSYDEDMNLVNDKRLNLSISDKDLELEEIVKFKGEYYLFLSFKNVEKKKMYLFYTRFDHHDLKLDGDLTKVAEVSLGGKSKDYSWPSFDISVSDNENYIVLFGQDATKNKSSKKRGFFRKSNKSSSKSTGTHNFKFTYWVLDKNFDIVNYEKKHNLKVENSSDKFYVRDYSIDDNGAIYILGKNSVVDELTRQEVRSNNRSAWVDINKSAFILEKINPDGTTVMQVTPEETLYVDMDILFDKDGNVNLLGLAGEQVYSKLVTTGVSRIVLDNENLDILLSVSKDFESEVLENINDIQEVEASLNKRQKKRRKRRERKLTAEEKAYNEIAKRAALNVNFIAYSGLDEEGDAVIVLEEQHLVVVTTTTTDANGNTTTTTTYYYHYDDLIMAKFIGDEVVQNYYKKSFVSVNVPLQKSLDVLLKDGEINIMTQGHIVKTDYDLQNVKDYELKAFERKDRIPGMRKKFFTYRKTIDENTILAPAQYRRKVAWYKISIK